MCKPFFQVEIRIRKQGYSIQINKPNKQIDIYFMPKLEEPKICYANRGK